MANATARVAKGTIRIQDVEFIKHSWATISAKTTLYTNAMVGILANGYLAKFDDTQALTFWGVIRGREGNPILPTDGDSAGGTQGDGTLDVDIHQPPRFEVAVSGVAITDIGRQVYATFDNAGVMDPGSTTYGNLIGTIVDLVYAVDSANPVSGVCLVQPTYGKANGGPIQEMGASGAVAIRHGTVYISKAGVAALTIADPTTGVHDGVTMTFISTTAQAHTLDNSAGSGFNAAGAGSDVGTFGGAKGDSITITAYEGVWYVVNNVNVTLA